MLIRTYVELCVRVSLSHMYGCRSNMRGVYLQNHRIQLVPTSFTVGLFTIFLALLAYLNVLKVSL